MLVRERSRSLRSLSIRQSQKIVGQTQPPAATRSSTVRGLLRAPATTLPVRRRRSPPAGPRRRCRRVTLAARPAPADGNGQRVRRRRPSAEPSCSISTTRYKPMHSLSGWKLRHADPVWSLEAVRCTSTWLSPICDSIGKRGRALVICIEVNWFGE